MIFLSLNISDIHHAFEASEALALRLVPKLTKWEQANPIKTGYLPLYTPLGTQNHVLQQKRN